MEEYEMEYVTKKELAVALQYTTMRIVKSMDCLCDRTVQTFDKQIQIINNMKQTIQDQQQTIKMLEERIDELEEDIVELEEKYDKNYIEIFHLNLANNQRKKDIKEITKILEE